MPLKYLPPPPHTHTSLWVQTYIELNLVVLPQSNTNKLFVYNYITYIYNIYNHYNLYFENTQRVLAKL